MVIVCEVLFDGELFPHRPLFFPNYDYLKAFDMSVVTVKDIRDIHSSIKHGVDFITISYVETVEDVLEVRELLSAEGKYIKVLAKIQNREALKNIDSILDVIDGIVIARGYLGLDIPIQEVAYVQTFVTKKCQM